MLASVQPIAADGERESAEAAEADDDDAQYSAGALLERGFVFLRSNKDEHAARSFRAAIETDNLNDAGRTLAYWHIHIAEQRQGNLDAAADALASFVVVGEDVLLARQDIRYAVDDSGDFVDRFDLEDRLSRARALLSVLWARQSGEYGRTEERPIVTLDQREADYFIEYMPPCADAPQRQVLRETLRQGRALQRVLIECSGAPAQEPYFIEVKDAAPSSVGLGEQYAL